MSDPTELAVSVVLALEGMTLEEVVQVAETLH
jgi:hypothetical protein